MSRLWDETAGDFAIDCCVGRFTQGWLRHLSLIRLRLWLETRRPQVCGYVTLCVRACEHACMRACMCVGGRVGGRARERVHVCLFVSVYMQVSNLPSFSLYSTLLPYWSLHSSHHLSPSLLCLTTISLFLPSSLYSFFHNLLSLLILPSLFPSPFPMPFPNHPTLCSNKPLRHPPHKLPPCLHSPVKLLLICHEPVPSQPWHWNLITQVPQAIIIKYPGW